MMRACKPSRPRISAKSRSRPPLDLRALQFGLATLDIGAFLPRHDERVFGVVQRAFRFGQSRARLVQPALGFGEREAICGRKRLDLRAQLFDCALQTADAPARCAQFVGARGQRLQSVVARAQLVQRLVVLRRAMLAPRRRQLALLRFQFGIGAVRRRRALRLQCERDLSGVARLGELVFARALAGACGLVCRRLCVAKFGARARQHARQIALQFADGVALVGVPSGQTPQLRAARFFRSPRSAAPRFARFAGGANRLRLSAASAIERALPNRSNFHRPTRPLRHGRPHTRRFFSAASRAAASACASVLLATRLASSNA